jgi:hypothetical protein
MTSCEPQFWFFLLLWQSSFESIGCYYLLDHSFTYTVNLALAGRFQMCIYYYNLYWTTTAYILLLLYSSRSKILLDHSFTNFPCTGQSAYKSCVVYHVPVGSVISRAVRIPNPVLSIMSLWGQQFPGQSAYQILCSPSCPCAGGRNFLGSPHTKSCVVHHVPVGAAIFIMVSLSLRCRQRFPS